MAFNYMNSTFTDDDPDVGDAERAKRRKEFPRGQGTGAQAIEETVPNQGIAAQSPWGKGSLAGVGDWAKQGISAINPISSAQAAPFMPALAAPTAQALATEAIGAVRAYPLPAARGQPQASGRITQVPYGSTSLSGATNANPISDIPTVSPEFRAQTAGFVAAPGMAAPVNRGQLPAGQYGMNDRGEEYNQLRPPPGYGAPALASTPNVAPGAELTPDQMNAPFNAAYQQMMAEKRGDLASQRQGFQDEQIRNERLSAAPSYRELEMAKSANRVAGFRATNGADMVLAAGNPAYREQRQGILAEAGRAGNRLAGMEAMNLAAGNATPQRNFAAENALQQTGLVAQQRASSESELARQAQAQNALMNPLRVAQAQQGLAAGATANEVAQFGLKRDQKMEALAAEYDKATPARQAEIGRLFRAREGRGADKKFSFQTVDQYDPISGLKTGQQVIATDPDTGEARPVGGPQAQQTPTNGEIRTDPATGKRGKYDAEKKKWVPA